MVKRQHTFQIEKQLDVNHVYIFIVVIRNFVKNNLKRKS